MNDSLLKWSGLSDRGKVRANNEDAFLGLRFDGEEAHYLGKTGEAASDQYDYVFAVSDGLGGQRAGEFASRIAVDKITHLLPRSFRHAAAGLDPGFADVLAELFDQIHRALTYVGQSYEECAGMQATLSLAWFTPGAMHFAHIGDSRIYYLPAGEEGIRQLSHDDTHVGWLFRNGQLNEREAREHPQRSALQKALGAGHQFAVPQVGTVTTGPGDRFLLCSDGVNDGLYDARLAELLRAPAPDEARLDPARRLVAAAVEASGRDNTTAVVVEVG